MTAIAIDPVTHDYDFSGGICQRDQSGGLMNAIVLRILTPLGTYWADPTIGSRLSELSRQKDVSRVAVLAKQYAEQALQALLDDSRAQSIDISTIQNFDGRLYLLVEVTAASGEKVIFKTFIKVGS